MSCEKLECDDMGNNMVFLEKVYCVWLCRKHAEEFLKNHPDYVQWDDNDKKQIYREHK